MLCGSLSDKLELWCRSLLQAELDAPSAELWVGEKLGSGV